MNCPRGRVCGINGCKRIHHRLLHTEIANKKNSYVKDQIAENKNETHNFVTVKSHPTVALRTVPVIVSSGQKRIKINALMDDASTKTYLNTSVAAELGLHAETKKITVNMLNRKTESFETMPVNINIESLVGTTKVNVEAHTTDNVTGNLKIVDWNMYSEKYPHLNGIEFPVINDKNSVDMLIGIDCLELHTAIYERRGEPGEPVARLTPLGWTCVGPVIDNDNSSFTTFFLEDQELNSTLKRFWEIEEPGSTHDNTLSKSEIEAISQCEQTMRTVENRYEIGIPWKDNKHELENNYEMAKRRLENTEKKLAKNTDLQKVYTETIEKYVEKGYVNKVQQFENDEQKWYLPHFPVVKPDRTTTKVRLVFDASAKYKNMSLNDAIHQGPKLQGDLFKILLRFRHYPVAVVCDIEEMYLQIGILPTDRKYHRFLWRDSQNEEPSEYEFNRVVFGVNASPFLAQFVSQENARKNAFDFPLAAETVLNSTYMDDSIDSVMTEEKGIELYTQLSQLWQKAGMKARKWLSNSRTILEHIPQENRAREVDLTKGELPNTKTLGMTWIPEDDILTFQCHECETDNECTKRKFLKRIATVFDPLGCLIPYTVRAKIIIQEMWTEVLDWDEELPEELNDKVRKWFQELKYLKNVIVERAIIEENTESNSLHTFVDASSQAIGAVVYSRNVDSNSIVKTKFIAAKSKVAPLKSVTIPRLELMAANLGLKLAKSVCSALNSDIKNMTFWSDSMNVLWWIRGPSRKYKPFVANRVGEIQSETETKQWRYVSTSENPADLASRGFKLPELQSSDL